MVKKKNKGLCSKLISIVNPTKFDILGTEFRFKYSDSSESYQTCLGGLLSILSVGLILSIAYSSFTKLRDTSSPEVTVSSQTLSQTPVFDLYNQSLLSPVSISGKNGVVISPSNIRQYATMKMLVYTEKFNQKDDSTDSEETHLIDMIPCSESSDQSLINLFRKSNEFGYQMAKNFGLCPDTKELDDRFKASGRFESPPFRTVSLLVLPCSLADESKCKTSKQLRGFKVALFVTRKAFDASNFTEPVSFNPEFDGHISLDTRSAKRMTFKLRRNQIWDSKLDFFEAEKKAEYDDYYLFMNDLEERNTRQIYCTPKEVKNYLEGDCDPYLTVSYQATAELKIMTRSYAKLFGTLGEVGGTAEIIIIASTLLYCLYNQSRLKVDLASQLSGGIAQKDLERYFVQGRGLGSNQRKGLKSNKIHGEEPEKTEKNSSKFRLERLENKRWDSWDESSITPQTNKKQKMEFKWKGKRRSRRPSRISKIDGIGITSQRNNLIQPKEYQEPEKVRFSKSINKINNKSNNPSNLISIKRPTEKTSLMKKREEQNSFESDYQPEKGEKTRGNKSLVIERIVKQRRSPGKKKKREPPIKDLINERLEALQNGMSLFRKLDQMEVLGAMLFEKHDQVLLPVVLMNLLKNKKEEKERALRSPANLLAFGAKYSEQKLTPEQAYDSLVKSQPKTELRIAVKRFMIENLPDYFKKQRELKEQKLFQKQQMKKFSKKEGLEKSYEKHKFGSQQNLDENKNVFIGEQERASGVVLGFEEKKRVNRNLPRSKKIFPVNRPRRVSLFKQPMIDKEIFKEEVEEKSPEFAPPPRKNRRVATGLVVVDRPKFINHSTKRIETDKKEQNGVKFEQNHRNNFISKKMI